MIAKPLICAAGALSLGLALSAGSATTASADAGAVVAGVIGGTALGAVIGSAAAAGPRYYPPPPVYVAPVEYDAPACWFERRPVLDPYGYVVGYRRARVCE